MVRDLEQDDDEQSCVHVDYDVVELVLHHRLCGAVDEPFRLGLPRALEPELLHQPDPVARHGH